MHLSLPIKKNKKIQFYYINLQIFFSFSGSFLDCILHLIVVNLIGLPPDVDDNFTVHALVKSDLQIFFGYFLGAFDFSDCFLPPTKSSRFGLDWIASICSTY